MKIITLCGSLKFQKEMMTVAEKMALITINETELVEIFSLLFYNHNIISNLKERYYEIYSVIERNKYKW